MYYRRKILLNLIAACGGEIDKLKLQKLLLIFCAEQEKPAFHFVPYKFGCFSFQANADLGILKKMGLIDSSDTTWSVNKEAVPKECLNSHDGHILEKTCTTYATAQPADLIKYTYIAFPYYALNSTIAKDYLNAEQLAIVAKTVKRDTTLGLFTIGYEGKSLEEFINILLRNNIKTLCDVRKNAFSMKYGFSKATLSNACENTGIKYEHLSGLGINSADRKDLKEKVDYEVLFANYRAGVLNNTVNEQKNLIDRIHAEKRVALMCFEALPEMCHRSHLAQSLMAHTTVNFPLVHL